MGYQDRGLRPRLGHPSDRLEDQRPERPRARQPAIGRSAARSAIARVRVTDVDRDAHPEPEIRPPAETSAAAAGAHAPRSSWRPAASIVPGRSGTASPGRSRPLTSKSWSEPTRPSRAWGAGSRASTSAITARAWCSTARAGSTGVEPEFLDYLDQLAEIANRHGITVMFSLTDNTMADGRGLESVEFIRAGEASERVRQQRPGRVREEAQGPAGHLGRLQRARKRHGPARSARCSATSIASWPPAGGPIPDARFTVVSRSRPEIVYWQGRGLDLYSHNIFTERSLEEALAEPRRPGRPDHGGRNGARSWPPRRT